MNELQIFNKEEFGRIRALVIDDEPHFVGKDVAIALGYKDTSDALKVHVAGDDKLTRCFTDSGQRRNMTVINESGLYSLIFGSKLEKAKKFKKWVTSEVLPSIRKTGSYNSNDLNQQKKYIDIMNDTADRINDPYLKDMFLKNRLENLYGIDLPEPTRITTPAADNKYSFNREKDLVKRFLEESCIIDKNSIVPSADLYNSFISWCEINEEEPVSQTMFGRKLRELGINKGRKSFMRFWKGIRL